MFQVPTVCILSFNFKIICCFFVNFRGYALYWKEHMKTALQAFVASFSQVAFAYLQVTLTSFCVAVWTTSVSQAGTMVCICCHKSLLLSFLNWVFRLTNTPNWWFPVFTMNNPLSIMQEFPSLTMCANAVISGFNRLFLPTFFDSLKWTISLRHCAALSLKASIVKALESMLEQVLLFCCVLMSFTYSMRTCRLLTGSSIKNCWCLIGATFLQYNALDFDSLLIFV